MRRRRKASGLPTQANWRGDGVRVGGIRLGDDRGAFSQTAAFQLPGFSSEIGSSIVVADFNADGARDVVLRIPSPRLCADNAAMIAQLGAWWLERGRVSEPDLDAIASLEESGLPVPLNS